MDNVHSSLNGADENIMWLRVQLFRLYLIFLNSAALFQVDIRAIMTLISFKAGI
jgi:hypothetical protein